MNEDERREVFVKIKSIAQQWYDTGMAIESLKGLVQNDIDNKAVNKAIKTWDADCGIVNNLMNDAINSSKDDLSQIYKRINSWKQ